MTDSQGIVVEHKKPSFINWIFSVHDGSSQKIIALVITIFLIFKIFPNSLLFQLLGLIIGMVLLFGAYLGSSSFKILDFKYYVEPPIGWEKQISPDEDTVRYISKDNSGICIYTTPYLNGDVDSWKEKFLNDNEYQLLNERKPLINGTRYSQITLLDKNNQKLQCDACIVNNVLYLLSYAANANVFEINYGSYEKLVKSFKPG